MADVEISVHNVRQLIYAALVCPVLQAGSLAPLTAVLHTSPEPQTSKTEIIDTANVHAAASMSKLDREPVVASLTRILKFILAAYILAAAPTLLLVFYLS